MHGVVRPERLRWKCDRSLPFATTVEVEIGPRIPGQSLAVEALRFAAECDAPSQNVFVRTREDVGGFELVLDVVNSVTTPCRSGRDHLLVANFDDPWRPRRLALPAGSGAGFRTRLRSLAAKRGRATRRRTAQAIVDEFADAEVADFVTEAVERAEIPHGRGAPFRGFEANLVHSSAGRSRVVVERLPSLQNLTGVATAPRRDGSDAHLALRGGSILAADGGFLVIDARELLQSREAFAALVRTLRTGMAELAVPASGMEGPAAVVRPEPFPVHLRTFLVGDRDVYATLAGGDPGFEHHFKVLADLEPTMNRDGEGPDVYARFLARLARDEGLIPFDATAVLALLEHGARIAACKGRVTARLLRIADLAREAEFLARSAGRPATGEADVAEAVSRTKRRGSIDSVRFRGFIADGSVILRVSGEQVGQVNGLSIIEEGPLTFGVPTRITASVAPGTSGIVDVEARAELSGSIHRKGFQILDGLLRSLLLHDHVLSFGASLAFEQTYGRVDGDSASAGQICSLLSALTGVPARQGLAITGSVDQLGNVQSIGGVNEKIEGFFDVCAALGFDGSQGVIIPATNVGDLMLRTDVVAACAEEKFHVHAVETIHDAIELLLDLPAGRPDENGVYPEGTLLRLAMERSNAFWRQASGVGVVPLQGTTSSAPGGGARGAPATKDRGAPEAGSPASDERGPVRR